LLLKLAGIECLLESDYGYRSGRPRQFDPRQVFFCSSLVSIPIADESCDLVLCTEVLEHIQEHEQALDELARVTAPGGWLLITVPTPPAIPDTNHVREGYREQELAGMLTRRGYRVVESRFCMYYFFRFVLANWSRWFCRPNILISALSTLDRCLPIGPPMDLLILAQRGDNGQPRARQADAIQQQAPADRMASLLLQARERGVRS
jgi:SAM-dependent methyltransferase